MAYTQTLGDLRSDLGIQGISGVCHDSQLFADQVNTVTRRLMRRGGFWKTEVLMRVCFQGCTLVWPRQVGTVLGVRTCCNSIPLKNNWWAVAGYQGGGWCGTAVIRDDDTRCCQSEITGSTGKQLQLHIVNNKDIGKTLKIFGFKYGNQPLQEKDSAGNWQMGLTLTATQTDLVIPTLVTKITSVVKQRTQGRMWLYEVEPDATLNMLSMYEPDETNPCYRASHIQNMLSLIGNKDSYGRCIRQAEVLVKLEFVPAVSDNDFVMLDNRDALELGIVALRAERSNDDVTSQIKWARAIQELNMEIRDRNPAMQTTIRTNDLSMSASCFSNPI